MTKKKKFVLVLIIVIVFTLAITMVAFGASHTKCKTIYMGVDGKVAKICYTMRVTWQEAQEQVTCNGEGGVATYIYRSGYSWNTVQASCAPNYYGAWASGVGSGRLKGPWGTKYHYADCSVYGDRVNVWYCGTN